MMKTFTVLTAGLGGVAVLLAGGPTVVSSLAELSQTPVDQSVSAEGVTSLNVDSKASRFDVEFDDVEEATLRSPSGVRGNWELERDGSELSVQSSEGWSDICFWCETGQNITLVLPEELNDGSLDAQFTLGSGVLETNGDFQNLYMEVGAGMLYFAGSAEDLEVTVQAGGAEVLANDVTTASADVNAGSLDLELSGETPDSVDLDVSAGNLDAVLPDDTYAVDSEVSAGSFDHDLREDQTSKNTVSANISAGRTWVESSE